MNKQVVFIGILIVVVAILSSFFNSIGLFSSVQLSDSPSWRFVNGCKGGTCYSGNYNIGELSFSADIPEYLRNKQECKFIDDEIKSFSETPLNCWSGSFSFDGDDFIVVPFETVQINDFIEVTWEPSGEILNGNICHNVGSGEDRREECNDVNYNYDWQDPFYQNEFTFRIYNPTFFATDVLNKFEPTTIQEETFITYNVLNSLTTIDGGAFIREEHKLFKAADIDRIELFTLFKGSRVYQTEVSSESLGDKTVSIRPFFIVENVVLGSRSEVRIFGNTAEAEFRVLPNIENIPQQDQDFWNRNPREIDLSGFEIIPEDQKDLRFAIFIILAIIIIGGVIIGIRKK